MCRTILIVIRICNTLPNQINLMKVIAMNLVFSILSCRFCCSDGFINIRVNRLNADTLMKMFRSTEIIKNFKTLPVI